MLFNTEIIGNVGRDAEIKSVGEHRVATFSVATKPYRGKNKDKTVWVNVTCWNGLADIVVQYVRKGMAVRCFGVLNSDDKGLPRIYEATDGTTRAAGFELNANEVLFLSKSQPTESYDSDSVILTESDVDLTEEIPF